jgi:hypothetical protein
LINEEEEEEDDVVLSYIFFFFFFFFVHHAFHLCQKAIDELLIHCFEKELFILHLQECRLPSCCLIDGQQAHFCNREFGNMGSIELCKEPP